MLPNIIKIKSEMENIPLIGDCLRVEEKGELIIQSNLHYAQNYLMRRHQQDHMIPNVLEKRIQDSENNAKNAFQEMRNGFKKIDKNFSKLFVELSSKMEENMKSCLESNKALLNSETDPLKKEIESLKKERESDQEKLVLNQKKFEQLDSINKSLQQDNKSLQLDRHLLGEMIKKFENERNDIEDIPTPPPSLSISMKSLLDLNDSKIGWKITENYKKSKDFLNQKTVFFGVLGNHKSGKSWICNQFIGKIQHRAGYISTTGSLEFVFPRERDMLIGVVDTPSLNGAIPVAKRMSANSLIIKSEDNGLNSDASKDEEYLENYSCLKDEAQKINYLIQKYVTQRVDICVFVCECMLQEDQEILHEIIQSRKEKLEDNFRRYSKYGSLTPEFYLYVIHNYKNLSKISDVQETVKKNLCEVFQLEEMNLFNFGQDFEKELNNKMYYDQSFKINHLILARQGTEAGEYYNPSTFAYLKEKARSLTYRTLINEEENFLDFLNKNLPKILKRPIQLKFNKNQTAIIKTDDSAEITLKDYSKKDFNSPL